MAIVGIDPGTSSGTYCINYFDPERDGRQRGIEVANLDPNLALLRQTLRALVLTYTRSNLIVFYENPTGLAFPGRKQGMGSTIKFARHVGEIAGLLLGMGLAHHPVRPQEWQKRLQCQTGGDKNVTYAAACRRFPEVKVTKRNADSILIAHYGCLFQLGEK